MPFTKQNAITKGFLGKKHSTATRLKLREAGKKNWLNKQYKEMMKSNHKGQKPWNTGKKRPEMSGEKHPLWKGGITPKNEQIRQSLEYKKWAFQVKKRDNFTCQICGDNKGGNLHANHIKKFSTYPDLRLNLVNGITLCEKCHLSLVTFHETEWEFYFYSNLKERGFIEHE